MKKFDVHVYATARIKLEGIEANNIKEAVSIAGDVNFHDLIDRKSMNRSVDFHGGVPKPDADVTAAYVEYDESAQNYLIDEMSENGEDVLSSKFVDDDGLVVVEGNEKLAGFDRANRFINELLDSVESLAGIAEEHGPIVLSNLLYLNHAIMTGGWIDTDIVEEESRATIQIIEELPSAKEWLTFTKVDRPGRSEINKHAG